MGVAGMENAACAIWGVAQAPTAHFLAKTTKVIVRELGPAKRERCMQHRDRVVCSAPRLQPQRATIHPSATKLRLTSKRG